MNKIMNKYLQSERNAAHQEFANADGFPGSDLYFAGGNDNPNFFNADAASGSAAPVRRSQPYILNITNISAAQVSSFDIFGAYQYLNTGIGTWANGSLTISGVTISSGLTGAATYQFLLAQSAQSPFSIGRTQITVGSGSSTQMNQPITVNTTDANGNTAGIPLIPVTSPFQQQTNTLILDQLFRIDGGTKLTMNILASVSFSLYLYPQDNINIARGLSGMPVAASYQNPNLGAAGNVVIKNG